jgi:succinoglycan biosynthesis transport protein ExoP
MHEGAAAEGTTLRDYVQVIRRRKWIMLLTMALVTVGAVVLSLRQTPMYQSSAEVLLNRQNSALLSGAADPNTYYQPERVLQTQAELARVPAVAQRVIRAAGANESVQDFFASSSVTSEPNSDILTFKVVDEDPELAQKLATAYAHGFTAYRAELDTAAITTALSSVAERITSLEAVGDRSSALYTNLIEKEQQLKTAQALQTSTLSVIREADGVTQTQPKPVRNGILALLVGLVLGIGLAFLWDALDVRVRTAEEIGKELELPLLARLPASARGQRSDQLSTLVDPHGAQAEAFRMLRTNLDFMNLERSAKRIMVTSAIESEGKSTTAANLAVTFARAGRRVTIVDLDLRRPFIARFFGLTDRHGLTHVALGYVELEGALATLAFKAGANGATHGANGSESNGTDEPGGILQVLTAGPTPPDPGEFANSHVISELLSKLEKRSDIVIIDAPPLLRVGDAMALSAKADGIIVVARLGVAKRPMLREIHRLMSVAPAAKLGFVVTGSQEEEGYGYASYKSYSQEPAKRPARKERVS